MGVPSCKIYSVVRMQINGNFVDRAIEIVVGPSGLYNNRYLYLIEVAYY